MNIFNVNFNEYVNIMTFMNINLEIFFLCVHNKHPKTRRITQKQVLTHKP